MTSTYTLEGITYDVDKLSGEGQKVFHLIALAEAEASRAGDKAIIAQAGALSLHNKLKEYLIDESIME